MCVLNASVVTMNPLRILDEVDLLRGSSVTQLHCDIMDGARVPRFGLYPEIVDELGRETEFELDLHLMVNDPVFFLKQLKVLDRVSTVSFHFTNDLENALYIADQITNMGCKPLLAINLSTPVSVVERLVRYGDFQGLNFLAIHPGVLQQRKRIDEMIDSIPAFIELMKNQRDLVLQCDGGVTFDSISKLRSVGVNNLVLGTGSIYAGRDYRRHDLDRELVSENLIRVCKEAGIG